jgi:SAM-dependent methyltransferase
MIQQPIRFDDGAAYDRMMGAWSQLVGQVFLDWLSPATGQRWIDVGCGNGAFTEQLIQRCAPVEAQAIDPSEAQLVFARTRPGAAGAVFRQGDAMVLPFEADRFDCAVMALVIHFLPDPAQGIGEMTRVVRPCGLVAAYVWDALGGGDPMDPIRSEMRALGLTPAPPPSVHASRIEALHGLRRFVRREERGRQQLRRQHAPRPLLRQREHVPVRDSRVPPGAVPRRGLPPVEHAQDHSGAVPSARRAPQNRPQGVASSLH